MKKDVGKLYDSTSSCYDTRYKDLQLAKYDRALMACGSVEGKILDVGCGTGLFSGYIGQKVWGIDSSRGMLQHSKGRIYPIFGDAKSMPFFNNSFDWVFSFTVLQNIHDYKLALNEMQRVLKISGRLVITYLNKREFDPIGRSIHTIFKVKECFCFSEDMFFFCTIK